MTTKIDSIRQTLAASIATKQLLMADEHIVQQIAKLAEICIAALLNGGKIIFAGNGGSFADAQHLSAELVSRFRFDRAPLASVVLGANSSALSAIGNDYGYERVFARELEAIARPGDVLVAISTSGNSANVVAVVEKSVEMGLATFCLTGDSGGLLAGRCECLKMPSSETARIQECHITVGHILCGLIEDTIFAGEK